MILLSIFFRFLDIQVYTSHICVLKISFNEFMSYLKHKLEIHRFPAAW